ncbi:hypothetical protein ESCO_001753 [Escovopsis weberi]|uniref:Uncharacterized protein n=1 Tax=Escovopsis weberi TaxID=150374 RepID=A0A0M9VWJ0_ESCWE|nr:hypothetical protein ESCO_001753 [Escovopsis weberi]
MGSPTKSLRTQASRSRFHEGSMNDKVSAVPPVQFLGPEERQALERPLELENQHYHQFQQRLLHPLQKAHSQIQIHLQTSSLSLSQAQTHSQMPYHSHSHQKAPSVYRKGGNLIGQVWGGMRDKLKLRKDSTIPADDFPKKRDAPETTPKRPDIDRPSREETLAAYQQLMASGFFTQHAIQSTRHARPSSIRPPCSRGSMAPSYMSAQQPELPHHGAPPPWSLSAPRTPNAKKPCSPFATPVSADSRGTKRAADENSIRIHRDRDSDDDDDDDDNDDDDDDDEKRELRHYKTNVHTNDENDDNEGAGDGHGESPARATTPHSKVRKIASKNFLPMPQLSGAKGKLLIARRMSSSASIGSGNLPPIIVQKKEPATKLSKGAQASANAASPSASPSRNSLDVLSGRRYSTPRRNASESYYSVRAVGSGSMTSRTQRPRENEGLSVMPDANRGIPRVPLIPSKYATGYGDDGENRQMWRPNCHLIS